MDSLPLGKRQGGRYMRSFCSVSIVGQSSPRVVSIWRRQRCKEARDLFLLERIGYNCRCRGFIEISDFAEELLEYGL